MNFQTLLDKYRQNAFSERGKGDIFERFMQAYLKTDPLYANQFREVWMWNEFPYRDQFGGKDTGIDLVALTHSGDYWAIQCKFVLPDTTIDKPALDSFLSTSSRDFRDETGRDIRFAQRFWISTSNHWGANAEEAIRNQNPPFNRIGLHDLEQSQVDWAEIERGLFGQKALVKKKEPFEYQKDAIHKVKEHFKTADRGKLIMACGTGKTFTSLKIAESETDGSGLILFLVPSIALLGQTLREWSAQALEPINAICICSDPKVSTQKTKNQDTDTFSTIDLALPASTNIETIKRQFAYIQSKKEKGLTVVFSTYQSIEVIARVQAELLKDETDYEKAFGVFDLIICDEAHRTTGVTLSGEDEAAFVKVHDNNFIIGLKRIYMTATPRLFGKEVKEKADRYDAVLCSMDDEALYGTEIYKIGFGEAVEAGLLTDYKVLIMTVSESDVPLAVQKMVADSNGGIKMDDASKLAGCINALSKNILGDADLLKNSDPEPMKRAVAFCSSIASSQKITELFNAMRHVETHGSASLRSAEALPQSSLSSEAVPRPSDEEESGVEPLRIDSTKAEPLPNDQPEAQHVDGTMSMPEREEKLNWLKEESATCRILTNARCLSEGVDVPSLDAVMFLSARNSHIDVVQSVGRVMRKAPGKKYGYIIIPILVPADMEADRALESNKEYKIVWEVLNALRSHDERFEKTINQIELNSTMPQQILVAKPNTIEGDASETEQKSANLEAKRAEHSISTQLSLQFTELQGVIYARMVKRVGNKLYWEQWAKDVASIAERYIVRINRLVQEKSEHQAAFERFISGLRENINPSISKDEAIEMLAQHIITKPVFDALFEGYSFVKHNPVSVAMQTMLDQLENENLDRETESLERFYQSVQKRASGINTAEGKQKIILELYDKFFKTAFPRMVEKLGIVYTPTEVVDFMIRSVDDLLKKEFGRCLSDEGIHILDPFTGTGTFMTRLLQSGLIRPHDLLRKYTQELHANEIVLLAYYIAAINIENAYHDICHIEAHGLRSAEALPQSSLSSEAVPRSMDEEESGAEPRRIDSTKAQPLPNSQPLPNDRSPQYTPFNGIVLTDTFQLGETEGDHLFPDILPQNTERVDAQRRAPLRVIIGNPPYSVGQKSANDNAQNQKYPKLDKRIEGTYVAETNATNKNSLYDSYIKAFRWSSDRLDKEQGGLIAFVSNGSWLDGNATDGFRKSLEKEFTSIYVFNLRGNQRTSGELSRKEGGKIFGSGSRTPISITFLVKNPKVKTEKATIHYHDIGDYLSREDKLKIIKQFGSADNIEMNWQILPSNQHADWIRERDELFTTFISINPENKFDIKAKSFFVVNSRGIETARDAWVYNLSKSKLEINISHTIDFYNKQVAEFIDIKNQDKNVNISDFIDTDSQKISWSSSLIPNIEKGNLIKIELDKIKIGLYRPFCKQHLYLGEKLIHRRGQFDEIYCNDNLNIVICVSGLGGTKENTTIITNFIPDLNILDSGTQCFPLYYYEEQKNTAPSLFEPAQEGGEWVRKDGISDYILKTAREQYGERVGKEDIFYYVYGFLHSPDYRTRFANDLKKMLPRLPLVEQAEDFWSYSRAGRQLANLHLHYENLSPAPGVTVDFSTPDAKADYRVEKMRFGKNGKADDRSTIHYNEHITISNIPLRAYEYIVNGKSAIEWIMERYQVTVHKESQIRNDPNDWATEHNQPSYIFDLLQSVIHLSLQTVEIVEGLPKSHKTDLSKYLGTISLEEDPLTIQKQMRDEWE